MIETTVLKHVKKIKRIKKNTINSLTHFLFLFLFFFISKVICIYIVQQLSLLVIFTKLRFTLTRSTTVNYSTTASKNKLLTPALQEGVQILIFIKL